MTWDSLFWIIISASWVTGFGCLLLSNRRLIRSLRELSTVGSQTFEGLSRTIHCLANRVNEQGWVDIPEEEWNESENAQIRIIREPGEGVRVLSK
jgi:hypothetical protein